MRLVAIIVLALALACPAFGAEKSEREKALEQEVSRLALELIQARAIALHLERELVRRGWTIEQFDTREKARKEAKEKKDANKGSKEQ